MNSHPNITDPATTDLDATIGVGQLAPALGVILRLAAQDRVLRDRLAKISGHDVGEAAAILLDDCPCFTGSADVPMAAGAQPKPVEALLTKPLNRRLCRLAMKRGLNSKAFARELLLVAIRNTEGLAQELKHQ